ncbi:hypothetical protein PC116_g19889 [Phytophthora cactorum]|nr:hypothetical protein PC114_g17370 [Phytophthora cactorum]KAG3001268.1 hypothetical protein PC119_g16784 [Phytophthora cactorum]KAG3147494.1 hypothetical protein C6341_g17729 [Phytophthora cactorum]KAG3173064.1 hypothetical protein PC128_g18366 [Phytophthora cactorum]KAG4231858.1 hypothetical protein PC116_g19889 [Phytophthora cactorum]
MAVMRGPGRTQGAAWTTVAEGDDGLGGDTEREDRRRHGEGRVDAAHGPVHMGPTRWKSIPAGVWRLVARTGVLLSRVVCCLSSFHPSASPGLPTSGSRSDIREPILIAITGIRRTHCQETTITTSQTESRVSQAD